VRSSWLSARAVLLHVTTVVLVATMAGLTWWQASRALSGNTLSYVYAFEWPLLAGVVVYMWWDLLHDRPRRVGDDRPEVSAGAASNGAASNGAAVPEPRPAAPRYRDDEDEELAAYNRYLAELNASGRRKTWRHPT
jgi:hypothetical protein